MSKLLSLIIALASFGNIVFAQGFISAAGSTMTNEQCKVVWHIGDMQRGLFTFGQSNTYVKPALSNGTETEFQLYPNPAKMFVTVKFNSNEQSGFTYRIIDLSGKLVLKGIISKGENTILLSGVAASVYVLQLSGRNKVVKSYKLIKL
jgi:hypothetical protein